MASEVYRYMSFDQTESFYNAAEEDKLIAAEQMQKSPFKRIAGASAYRRLTVLDKYRSASLPVGQLARISLSLRPFAG